MTAVDGNVVCGSRFTEGAMRQNCGTVCICGLVAARVLVSSSSVKSMTDLLLSATAPAGTNGPAAAFVTCACNVWHKQKKSRKSHLTVIKNKQSTKEYHKLNKLGSLHFKAGSEWNSLLTPSEMFYPSICLFVSRIFQKVTYTYHWNFMGGQLFGKSSLNKTRGQTVDTHIDCHKSLHSSQISTCCSKSARRKRSLRHTHGRCQWGSNSWKGTVRFHWRITCNLQLNSDLSSSTWLQWTKIKP